ncbi:MAG: UvrD-helicase domain-containing protein [Kofleriaceae bacterium]
MTLRLVTDESAASIATAVRVARPASLPPASDRFVVVEASAGTGKTYFLEHRVVDLILAGAELGQILLVTFTDKAVAELRMRIRDLLDRLSRSTTETAKPGEPAWTLDDDARRKLRAAVTAFDYAPIFTIHGFCHRVLVEDAFAARRLFEQTQIADEVAFDAAFDALLRERFARVQPDRDLLHAYLSTDRTVDHLRKLLLQCARADAPVRRQLDPERARAIAADLHAQLGAPEQRQAVLAPMKGNYARWCGPWLDKIGAELAQWKLDTPTPELLALIDRMREPIEKLHEKLVELLGRNPPTAVITALRGVLATVSLNEALATELLPHILARVEVDKSERGLFDYDDMLELVARALRGPRGPELAARLRARTPWVMIDEFQDTDPVQWEIFRTVWMHVEAKGLTIVGDPKQAIYGFRGADVATYMAARDEMLRNGATRVALDVNRRSTAQLVEAVNHILVGNFGLRLLDGDITYDEPVKASGDIVCEDRRAPVEVLHLQSGGKPKADENKATLMLAIGDAIEKLRANPMRWRKRGQDGAAAFALGHVMVLTRSNRDSTEIATSLRARGLACALVEPEKLFETREAYELAAVLAAIAAPRDRSARMRALRTRFFDVPWAELPLVTDAPDHHPLVARLFDWAQLASRRAYESLFRKLVEDSRFAERALVLGGGERALTNTWHLIELLLAEVARARCDLHELVVQLRRWMADDTMQPDERDVQRAETESDAIRILTIHKAKGLEAPYVFVYGGLSGTPKSAQVHTLRDPAGRALIVGQPDPVTKAQLENEQLAEDQRLAYVALTRAQVRLYLPLYPGLTKGASYGPVQTCLGASVTAQNTDSLPRILFEDTPLWVEAIEDDAAPLDALASFDAPPPPVTTELAPLPSERSGLTMLSYTRLANLPDAAAIAARAGDLLAIDPAEFDTDDSVGEVGPDELPPGASAGLLVHDVLENADLELARDARDVEAWRAHPEIRPAFVDAARDRGIDERYLRHASELVYRTLTVPLALTDGGTLPALVHADAIAREVEFNYPIPGPIPAPGGVGDGVRRGLVKGFIDALVVYGDELWVLDYKTDLLSGDDLPRAADLHVRNHYAVQARLYAIAADKLRGSRRLGGLLYQFVRHDITVPLRMQGDTLAMWTAWLAGLPTLPATMSREVRP